MSFHDRNSLVSLTDAMSLIDGRWTPRRRPSKQKLSTTKKSVKSQFIIDYFKSLVFDEKFIGWRRNGVLLLKLQSWKFVEFNISLLKTKQIVHSESFDSIEIRIGESLYLVRLHRSLKRCRRSALGLVMVRLVFKIPPGRWRNRQILSTGSPINGANVEQASDSPHN